MDDSTKLFSNKDTEKFSEEQQDKLSDPEAYAEDASDINSEAYADEDEPYFDYNFSCLKEYVNMEQPEEVFTDILSETNWSIHDMEKSFVMFFVKEELELLNYDSIRNIPQTDHVLSPIHNRNFVLVEDYFKKNNYFVEVLQNIANISESELHRNNMAFKFIIHYTTPMIQNWDRYCANIIQLGTYKADSAEDVEDGWDRAPKQFVSAIKEQSFAAERNEKDPKSDKFVSKRTSNRVIFSNMRRWLFMLSKKQQKNTFKLESFLREQNAGTMQNLFLFTVWYYHTFPNDYYNDHGDGLIIPQLLAEDIGSFVCFVSEVKSDEYSSHWFAPFGLRRLLPQYSKAYNDSTKCEEKLQNSSFGYRLLFCKTYKFQCPEKFPAKGLESLEIDESSKDSTATRHFREEGDDEVSPALTRTFSGSDMSYKDSHSESENSCIDYDFELLFKNRLPKEEGVYIRHYFLDYNSHNVDILNEHGLVERLEQERISDILEQLEFKL